MRPLGDVPESQLRASGQSRGQGKDAAPEAQGGPPESSPGSTPLGPGQVRKKSTGELGKILSVDPKAGTAVVRWMREGRTSTVPLTAISRR